MRAQRSSRTVRRTTVVLCGCVAFLLGLGLAHRHVTVPGAVVLLCAVVLAWMWWRKPRTVACLLLAVVCGGLLGMWRGGAYMQRLQPFQDLARQKVTFIARASIDGVYGTNGQMSFTVRDVTFREPYGVSVPGTIKVQGFGAPMIYRGDTLTISGKLYPTRGANQATVSYAELSVQNRGASLIDEVRRRFAAGMQSALPEPAASFGLGLLVGQRNTLPAEVSQTLLMVGLTHIIAVSGYNLTILLEAAKRLMGNRSKRMSVAVALGLIAGFLLVTGNSASIVRAAVISSIGLAAWYYGRTVRPLVLIAVAAAGTGWANPVYVWSDIAWYLSFLAFFGVLVVAPRLIARLYGEKKPSLIMQIILESLCAELMTMPLVLYVFGQTSLVSLLANVLIAALIPLAMALSFVAGLAGMFAGAVAGWFAWPATLLLTYMLDVASLLSRIPHVFQENRYITLAEMVAWYGLVAGLLMLGHVRQLVKRRTLLIPQGSLQNEHARG